MEEQANGIYAAPSSSLSAAKQTEPLSEASSINLTDQPLEIFIVCSQDEQDQVLCQRLKLELQPLCRSGKALLWDENMLLPGEERQQTIERHLERSKVVLFLLSSFFFASDVCFAFQQRLRDELFLKERVLIPIILRPCHWEEIFNELEVLPSSRVPITSWSNDDEAFHDILKSLRRLIGTQIAGYNINSLFDNDFKAVEQSHILPSCWNIPYLRNLFFTGRENILATLHDLLTTRKRAALTQALTGLGGIGKSQTAIEYAHRYHNEYTAVLWVRADSHEALIADYMNLADVLHLPVSQDQNQRHIIPAVRQWCNAHTGWLLIFDDVENIQLLNDFLPQSTSGHVILTTRAHSVGTVANALAIEKMQLSEGILFLLRRAKRVGPDDAIENASEKDQSTARDLATLMDGLPLALDQAGAYIEETGCSLDHYLDLYQKRRTELLKRRGKQISDHPASVATTFSLCFEEIAQINPISAELLRCCALLHPDNIPEEIMTDAAIELGSTLAPLAQNPLLLNEAVADLCRYSLIQRDGTMHLLSIHRLVQAVLVDNMSEQMQQTWAERIVKAVRVVFPRKGTTWQYQQRYLIQAQVCATLIKQRSIQGSEIERWLHRVGWTFEQSGFYTLAEQLYTQSNMLLQKDVSENIASLLGEEYAHNITQSSAMETLKSAGPLPHLYFQQGKYTEAEKLFLNAIRSIEQHLGTEHPSLITHLDQLGTLYSTTGRYDEAEELLQRALNIHIRRTSEVDLDGLATLLNSLADLYRRLSKYEKAEPLYQQSLHLSETQFGPNHIKTANSAHNLALVYRAQNKYTQAEPLYQRARIIYEHTSGPESPYLATTINSLGSLYAHQERYAEAEPLFLKALAIREKVLGPEHADVGRTLNNLGNLYIRQEKYEQAQQSLQRSLEIYTKSLGEEHPEVAMPLTNLGHLYSEQKMYSQAEAVLERALFIHERTVGLHSPEAFHIFQALFIAYAAQKKISNIQYIAQHILPGLKERLGDHHPEVQALERMIAHFSHILQEKTEISHKPFHKQSRFQRTKKRRKKK